MGRTLGAVQVCIEAVNGEVRGSHHRGHMEEELATQGTCGSVTHMLRLLMRTALSLCQFPDARKVFDGIPYS